MPVHLLNGKTVTVTVSYLARAKDVIAQCGKELKLGDAIACFQLFVVSERGDTMIKEGSRITDRMVSLASDESIALAVAYYLPFSLFNQAAIEFFYDQAVHDLPAGRYFRADEDYFVCISLVLQKRMQDYIGDNRLLWYCFLALCHVVTKSEAFSHPISAFPPRDW